MKFIYIFFLPAIFVCLVLLGPPIRSGIDSRVIFHTAHQAGIPRPFSKAPINLQTKVVASGLDIPWEIAWGPDNMIWVTEQRGTVSRINPESGAKKVILRINDVWFLRTAGLLGMALHPDMKNYPYVFLNYTFTKEEKPFSRLVRYTWRSDTLINPKVLMEIPAANGHSGSRISIFQGKVFWATGDAASMVFAQDSDSPNGKILRLNIDGSVPSDNPVKGSPVWAMGFRNIQGMVFSRSGKLYTSEHGDATDDEVNLIEKTKNYGWPLIQGFAETPKETELKVSRSTVDPMKAWTPTIAPAGIDYYFSTAIPQWQNSLLLVSLKGKSLRSLKLDETGNKIIDETAFFENQFGRLRDICISPSGDVYISTSNRDWNRTMGDPLPEDDRIIRITYSNELIKANDEQVVVKNATASLYQQYCASCHRADGAGLKDVFPPLKGSELVKRGDLALVAKVLNGSTAGGSVNSIKYDAQMPSFSFLKDEELADIIRYVRSMNSLDVSDINPETIKKVRGKTKGVN